MQLEDQLEGLGWLKNSTKLLMDWIWRLCIMSASWNIWNNISQSPFSVLPNKPQNKLTQGLESRSEGATIFLCAIGQGRATHHWSSRTWLMICGFSFFLWGSGCFSSFSVPVGSLPLLLEILSQCMTRCGEEYLPAWVWWEVVRDRHCYHFVFGGSCCPHRF